MTVYKVNLLNIGVFKNIPVLSQGGSKSYNRTYKQTDTKTEITSLYIYMDIIKHIYIYIIKHIYYLIN